MNAIAKIAPPSRRERAIDIALDCGRFRGLRVADSPLIALAGAFRVDAADDPRERVLQHVAVALAADGRGAIADALERRGAALSLDAEPGRIAFSALACAEDLPLVAEALAEHLREPAFDPRDLIEVRARLAAEWRHGASDLATLASEALSRLLYPRRHPRHEADLDERIAWLESLTVDDVRGFHRDRFRPHDFRIAAAGGVAPFDCAAQLERHLSGWAPRAAPTMGDADTLANPARTLRLDAPGHSSFAVVLGVGLSLRHDDPDLPALWLADRILGATYASRLVAGVREALGLSYSIRSTLIEPDLHFAGHWQIALSASPDTLPAAIAATRAEIVRFVEDGASAHELAAKRREAVGAYPLGLTTLQALSAALLRGADGGWMTDDVEDFAARIGAVTPQRLRRVVADQLRPDALQIAIAGPWDAAR